MRRCVLLLFFLYAFPAWSGDTGLSGFNIRSFRPSTDGTGIYNTVGASVLKPKEFHAGFLTNVSFRSLKMTNAASAVTTQTVDVAWDQNLFFSLGVINRLAVGLDLPFTFYQDGINFNSRTGYRSIGLGDVRLNAKYNFFDEQGWWPNVGLLTEFSFPTGNRKLFMGDKNVGWENRLIADKSFGPWDLFSNIGYRWIDNMQVRGTTRDDQWVANIGARYFLPWQNKSWAVESEVALFPVQWIAGAQKRLANGLSLRAAVGVGLNNAVGNPPLRLIAGLQFRRPEIEKRATQFQESLLPDLVLVHTIHFLFNSSEPTPKQILLLQDSFVALREASPKRILLQGHTDSFGEELYNESLGLQRAERVKQILEEAGFENVEIITKSFGSDKPIASDTTIEGQQENRRVEIFIIPVR